MQHLTPEKSAQAPGQVLRVLYWAPCERPVYVLTVTNKMFGKQIAEDGKADATYCTLDTKVDCTAAASILGELLVGNRCCES